MAGAGSALGCRVAQHEHVYQLIVGRHVETSAHGLGVVGANPAAAQAKGRCGVCHVGNDDGGIDGAEIARLATHALSRSVLVECDNERGRRTVTALRALIHLSKALGALHDADANGLVVACRGRKTASLENDGELFLSQLLIGKCTHRIASTKQVKIGVSVHSCSVLSHLIGGHGGRIHLHGRNCKWRA